ncbi:ABC transporter permease [Croceicoccus sp. Ery15]|uniref:ABC transporter permease n=1 Tax=Croceicoccus sp. Ery15 TaxID=1703338 RepID=UPI001E5C0B49|nr:ABC transporter permease [Croceicoccus sp. Ery15]
MKHFLSKIMVIARRDFRAILFSRSFLFFILGPLFPVIVAWMAGGIGASVQGAAGEARLGIAMSETESALISDARQSLHHALPKLPGLEMLQGDRNGTGEIRAVMADGPGERNVAAVLAGTLDEPSLSGPSNRIAAWQGDVSLLVDEARRLRDLRAGAQQREWPAITMQPMAQPSQVDEAGGRIRTAQAGQTLLFLLTMLLAGMVLSNLVEEKANKIIEVLAAAVPMDAVFFGKLLAMLGVSFVGIAVWGSAAALVLVAGGSGLSMLATPAVGWPVFILLCIAYFACAYLLLGSLFLSIGGLAATVREVQTLSMPVTMAQLLVFFLASYALGHQGQPIEMAAAIFPFSSPFAMLARAAMQPEIWPHFVAIAWQALWVFLIVRAGAALFRKTVMKSGPAKGRRGLGTLLSQSVRSFRRA